MRRKNRKHLFYSYIISYVGIVLIALSLLCSLAMWSVAENMKEEELRIIRNRMYTVVNDIEEQIETMRIITLNVASRAEFRKDTFQKNKYLEIEMLENLQHYNWTTAVCDFFFLKYQDEDTIFTSDGKTSSFQVYCQNRIRDEERENVCAAVEKAFQDGTVSYVLAKTGNSSVLMIYPLKKYAASSIGMEGVLCFEIKEKLLKERMEQMAGELPGSVEIYCDDFPLISMADQENTGDDLLLEAISANGRIRIVFRPEADDYFNWSNVFTPQKAAILIGITLLLLIIALVEAWKSYAPIRKLVKKYNIKMDTMGANELDRIDSMIASMVQREEKDGKRLQKQFHLLREQILCMIVSEGYSSILQSRMTMLNIRLDGAVFGKLTCDFENVPGAEGREELAAAAEELSDEGVSVYAFWKNENQMEILVSAEEEYQIEDLCEALVSLFEAKEVRTEVKLQGMCRDIQQIHEIGNEKKKEELQKLKKITDNQQGSVELSETKQDLEEAEKLKEENTEDFKKQSATAAYAVKYIDENFTRYDLSLDLVATELHITSPYLCRLIKQQTGMNYKEYLTRLRMVEAKKLLQNKNASIADVCQQTGYSNVSHFIKTFQKYEGITPAKYRDIL